MAVNIVIDTFEKNKERIFIIDSLSEKAFSFGEFNNFTLALCVKLNEKGIKRGSRIAVCLPNSVEFAAVYFAAVYLGFYVVPINTNLNFHELEYISMNCKAEFFIYSKTTKSYVESALKKFPQIERIPFLTGAEKRDTDVIGGYLETKRLYDSGPIQVNKLNVKTSPEGVFAIMYTSGTTRFPKGVSHSINNMVWNALAFIKELEISPHERFYDILSMAYMAGFYNLIFLPFLAGASVVIGEVFNPQQTLTFWRIPMKYKVNTLWLVPTMLSILLKLDRGEEGPKYCKESIRHIFVGTAPLPFKLQEDFEERYGLKIFENYGLSETLFISVETPKINYTRGSVGKILPNCSVEIIGSDGRRLPLNTEGEIAVRTPSLMLGYLSESTGDIMEIDPDKSFPTGDVGYLTAEGRLFITGRRKDLIIKGGINVSPQAIENILASHEAIEQAVVAGIPHTIYGEDIAAVIKLKEGRNFEETKQLLIEYCKNNLSLPQQPSMFFEIEEFPLTSTGKIDRKRLKKILLEKLRLPGAASRYIGDFG